MQEQNLMVLYLRIRPNRIHFLKFILEAYEGLAVLSVERPKEGLIYIRFDRNNSHEVIALLGSLCQSSQL
jgi:hypothetical protein